MTEHFDKLFSADDEDGSVNLVTVGISGGPMFFPGGYPMLDENKRILEIVVNTGEQITFNFDHVVFYSTSKLTEDDIRKALEAEESEA
ncbi:hypothetical protein [Nocardia terpenica]|uniref:hypothetical protein n=1 Tax=Nocardia terpenica TaxID=455432 RepID=UPI0012FD7F0E|nr:hypothetical protein [Nocardia terpenica]